MKTLLLIDAMAIIHRAYFALPELTTNAGIPTNAIYGFFTMLHKAISDFQPHYIAVCFDTPKPTFRKELFKEYQAHRPKATDGFKVQIPIIKELLDLSGIHRTEKPGFEADDVIGTMATRYGSEFERILVLTGDKDMMQLARKNVFIVTPQKGLSTVAIYGPDAVQERFGIMPELIPDFKGLMGDPSDNYKGAPGIGPKTATKLLTQFKSVEHMIEHVNEIQPERIQSIIKENTESIVLSKKLATILTDMELGNSIEECQFNGFRPEMRAKLEELQLYSLIGRFYGGKNGATKKQVEKKEELEPSESDPQLDLFS